MGSVYIKLRLQLCHVGHTSQVCQLLFVQSLLVTVREDHSLETSTETTQHNTKSKKPTRTTLWRLREARALEPGGTRNKVEWAGGALDR